jgi:hypothetical protein
MSLLSGIISGASLETPNLNTSTTSYVVANSSSSSVSITGANSGQLYILCHNAYNPSGISSAPATPSGFTSLSSYAASGNIFSFRLSYKILTSNEFSYTLPSVSDATGQVATGLVVSTLSGGFNGLSVQNSLGYTYASSSNGSGDINASVNNIVIGFGLFYLFTGGGSGINLPSPSVGAAQTAIAGGAVGDLYYSVVHAKNYTTSDTASWQQSITGATATLYNTFALRPTFS